MERADLILTDIDFVLTMDENFTEYKNTSIAIKDGKIVDIGEDVKNKYFGKTIVCKGKIAIPGLINTHTHAAMTLLRGYGSDNPLKVWLEEYIWPVEGQFVSYEFVKEGTQIAVYEMLRNGVTTFVDMYFYENAVADVLNQVGMRGVLSTGILDFPTPGAKTPDEGIAKTEEFIKEHKGSEYIYPAIGPHAPYTCSPETLKKAMDVAEKYDVLLHTHLAETEDEEKYCLERFGMRPVDYMESLGWLNNRVWFAHLVWLTNADIEKLAKTDSGMAHCPSSNMRLGSGIAPVYKMKNKMRIGIAVDGSASNDTGNMLAEIRNTLLLQRVKYGASALTPYEVLKMATIGGAQILRMNDYIGTLEEEKAADFIGFKLDRLEFSGGLSDPVSALVMCDAKKVDLSVINGEIRIRDGIILDDELPIFIKRHNLYSKELLSKL